MSSEGGRDGPGGNSRGDRLISHARLDGRRRHRSHVRHWQDREIAPPAGPRDRLCPPGRSCSSGSRWQGTRGSVSCRGLRCIVSSSSPHYAGTRLTLVEPVQRLIIGHARRDRASARRHCVRGSGTTTTSALPQCIRSIRSNRSVSSCHRSWQLTSWCVLYAGNRKYG
jgi:hypothetical protein